MLRNGFFSKTLVLPSLSLRSISQGLNELPIFFLLKISANCAGVASKRKDENYSCTVSIDYYLLLFFLVGAFRSQLEAVHNIQCVDANTAKREKLFITIQS